MARTVITPTPLAKGTTVAEPVATNTTAGANNGITIPYGPERTILRVTGTNAGNAVVKAGAGVASISAGQGDLTVAIGAGQVVWLGPFESARFQAADASLSVDTSAAMAVQAFTVDPR